MKLIRTMAVLAASASFAATSAYAADSYATQEEISSAIEVAFGATITSRYVSRGVANSDGPALQAYLEPSYGMFYAGVWASTVDLDPDDVEIDLYVGIRPQFGDLSLDIGYVRYLYDNTGDCCGEIYGKADYAFTDAFSAGVELYFDPENDTTYGVVGAEVGLPYDFTLSGGVGTWFEDDMDWNVGLSYTFEDMITIDARYHDSDHSPARFVASLSFDSSFKLFDHRR